MKKLIWVMGIFLLLTACKDAKMTTDKTSLSQLEGTFVLTELPGATLKEKVPYLIFESEASRVNGNTSCNSFFGMYQVKEGTIAFRDIASTEMDCGPEIMKVEMAFLNALRDVGKATLAEDKLTFYAKDDERVLLRASKKPMP